MIDYDVTVTAQVANLPEPSVAEQRIVASPADTPVTFPSASTVATAGSLEDHARTGLVGLAGVVEAVSVLVPSTATSISSSFRVIAVIRVGGVVSYTAEYHPLYVVLSVSFVTLAWIESSARGDAEMVIVEV